MSKLKERKTKRHARNVGITEIENTIVLLGMLLIPFCHSHQVLEKDHIISGVCIVDTEIKKFLYMSLSSHRWLSLTIAWEWKIEILFLRWKKVLIFKNLEWIDSLE